MDSSDGSSHGGADHRLFRQITRDSETIFPLSKLANYEIEIIPVSQQQRVGRFFLGRFRLVYPIHIYLPTCLLALDDHPLFRRLSSPKTPAGDCP